jgi:hypothetical protein
MEKSMALIFKLALVLFLTFDNPDSNYPFTIPYLLLANLCFHIYMLSAFATIGAISTSLFLNQSIRLMLGISYLLLTKSLGCLISHL